jgi:hypothetical protein
MPKRKLVAEPQMWKVKNVYLSLLSKDQYATVEYQKLKAIYPNIRVCFIKNATNRMQAIFAEISDPTPFPKIGDNYHVVEARTMNKEPKTIKLGKYEVTWNGKNIKCLGSRICKKCFLQGKLYPRTCHLHLQCLHGKNKIRNCKSCVSHTLLGFWKVYIACFQGGKETLFTITHGNNKTKNLFKCSTCQHFFLMCAHKITSRGDWCPFCSNMKLCDEILCQICHDKSFASHEKAKYWNKEKNNILPRNVFCSSNTKRWFDCGICNHTFNLNLNNLYSRNGWCRYCAHKALCDDEKCKMCFTNSFAKHEKSKYWHPTKNYPLVPRQVLLGSGKKCWFYCTVCFHDVDILLHNVVSGGQWCRFCAHFELCNDLICQFCFNNSFASQNRSKFWHPTKNYPLIPRQIFMRSHTFFWFFCTKCNHDFDASPNEVSSNCWCPFCAGKRRCDQPNCKTCAQSCNVCLVRKAQTKTQNSRIWVCFICLEDAIRRNPNETPVSNRAKISLEIYTLAELIRQSSADMFIENPTAWDCPILPGLNFKPDVIWCFDEDGYVIQLGNANKLNMNTIRYALQVEIMEGSRVSHSLARNIPDEDRALEIRKLFASQRIPFGLLNVTIAHTKHIGADPNDVFFIKPGQDQEYHVIPNKLNDWIARVVDIRDTLLKMFAERSNETICIGG